MNLNDSIVIYYTAHCAFNKIMTKWYKIKKIENRNIDLMTSVYTKCPSARLTNEKNGTFAHWSRKTK